MKTADRSSLRERLLEEDAFVRKLVDTIPPKIYFNQEINEYLEEEKHAHIDADVKKFGPNARKLKIKGKQKRARFDPYLHKTVSQIQEDVEKRNGRTGKKKKRAPEMNSNPLILHERLSKKIETLKATRLGPNGSHIQSVKRRTKELKKNWKKKNKSPKTVTFDVSQKSEKRVPKIEAPVFNKEGKIVYSKFDFMDENETGTPKKKPFGKNNFKKALDKINNEKEKLQELSSRDPQKAENLTKKLKWKTALNKAEGIKVKDNPELLKKSIKRREFSKKKSQKQWEARSENVQKGMDQRQTKRTKNIRAKKQQKIDKKVKLARRKGRFVNGF